MKEFWFVIDASILWQSFAESLYSVMYQTNVMHWVRIPHWGRCLAEPSDHELWISPLIIAWGSITNSSSALVHILAHTDTNTGTQTHTQTQRRFHKQIQTHRDTHINTDIWQMRPMQLLRTFTFISAFKNLRWQQTTVESMVFVKHSETQSKGVAAALQGLVLAKRVNICKSLTTVS